MDASENGEVEDPPNFLIQHQRGRIIRGIVKINYQHLQEHSMIFCALCRSQGRELDANIQITEARNLFQELWPDFPVPHRNKFSRFKVAKWCITYEIFFSVVQSTWKKLQLISLYRVIEKKIFEPLDLLR